MARTKRGRQEQPLALERLEDRCLLSYTITDLGTLGGMDSYAYGINNHGQVVGEARTADGVGVHAFFWQDGVMTDLGTFGGPYSAAYAINDASEVVGSADLTSNVDHAFRWSSRRGLHDLGTLGGTNSSASGINNTGQIVGSSDTSGTYTGHAFLYRAGQLTDLGTLGGPHSDAVAMNDAGQVVGSADTTDFLHSPDAFLESDGPPQDLGTLPGGSFSFATGINAAGQVCGWSSVPLAYSHAFVYSDGVMTDIGTLFGTKGSPNNAEAYGINDAGQVVGESAFVAFVYQDATMTDLNLLLPPDAGWHLLSARGINNAGEIVGYGNHNGAYHAFLLTPDGPSTAPARLRLDPLTAQRLAAPCALAPAILETTLSDTGRPTNLAPPARAETSVQEATPTAASTVPPPASAGHQTADMTVASLGMKEPGNPLASPLE
jgi:probable HAF family extracellular repeat protein